MENELPVNYMGDHYEECAGCIKQTSAANYLQKRYKSKPTGTYDRQPSGIRVQCIKTGKTFIKIERIVSFSYTQKPHLKMQSKSNITSSCPGLKSEKMKKRPKRLRK